MASDLLIIAETSHGSLRSSSLELVTAAETIGGSICGVVAGSGIGSAAEELGGTGIASVLSVDHERLDQYTTDAFAAVVEAAIRQESPAVVLFTGSTSGRDLAPRVAARFGAPLEANIVAVRREGDTIVATRSVLGGRVQSDISLTGDLVMMSVSPGLFAAAPVRSPETAVVSSLPVDLSTVAERVRVIGVAKLADSGGTKLEHAEVIVAGGRGLKEAANFGLVEELATRLNGAVAASRAVVDAGWRSHHEQIGQTGKTVAPRLYIAIGISGAVQHNVGMQGSENIVVINRDPDAPMFKLASFGIVGDLFEIVPELTKQLAAL